jgi:hypothetical protein
MRAAEDIAERVGASKRDRRRADGRRVEQRDREQVAGGGAERVREPARDHAGV